MLYIQTMFQRWRDLSVTKKLYAVVGLMAVLIATELFTLIFAMHTLSSVRAFVAGEGLWTKAQKDAIHSLYQYALIGDRRYFNEFDNYLKINDGDHIARLELMKSNFSRERVREGFIQGGNHPDDIDGMINLLVRFNKISYIHDAIVAWTTADLRLAELRKLADTLHTSVINYGRNSAHVRDILARLATINSDLEEQEVIFSSSLGAGSRWLENVLMTILTTTVFTIESTGIFLTFRFSRNLSRTLNELKDTANTVGEGDFSVSASVQSQDELGQLALALNKMIGDLRESENERRHAERRLQIVNEELERRVAARTRDLQYREEQLRQVTNALPVLVGQFDVHGVFQFANDALCNWFGLSSDQVIGKTLQDLIGAERFATLEQNYRDVLDGKPSSCERLSEVGSHRAMYDIAFVPEFIDGNVIGFILVASDITKYKEIQGELEKAKQEADVANATKSAFLANMSHEIRTPLGVILGFSELMLGNEMTPSERQSSVEVIKRNGDLLSNIINDILDLSKVEAGKLEIEKIDVPFDEVVNEIESLLTLQATEKGIELTVSADAVVPTTIKTDPLRLRQILLNIIGNAIKFTDRGSVSVKIRLVPSAEGAMKLAFIVQDTGKGIPKDQAQKLFAPFTQADASTTRKFGGTGLGLVLSKKLANALGGDVVLSESGPGIGSTFTVTIDPGNSEKVLFQNFNSLRTQKPIEPLVRTDRFSDIKVLLVDDSFDNRALITQFLKRTGATVDTASNGQEGVEKAINGDYGLVLMDLQMPIMDGYEALKELRHRGYQKPIVALTAHAMKEERRRSLESGFDDHLSKPINRDLLLDAIVRFAGVSH